MATNGVFYLTHPRHGVHVAYSRQEVEACKANGWQEGAPAEEPPAKREVLGLPRRRGEGVQP